MAVINTVDDAATHPEAAATRGGMRCVREQKIISIAAADDDGSIFLIAELPDSAIIDDIMCEGNGVTGGTDYDIGLYDVDGTVIDKDCFADGIDFSSISGLVAAGPHGEAVRHLMPAVTIANSGKKLYEYAGHVNKTVPGSGETNRKSKYRLALTCNTIGSETVDLLFTVDYRVHF